MEHILKRPFYTKYAWVYDKIIERPFKSDCDFIEKILIQKTSNNNLSILDVGCGTGNYSNELARRGFQVTGIDISKEQITVAKSKPHIEKINIEFLQLNIFEYKFEQQYDLILCRGVLNDIIENVLRAKIFKVFKSLLSKDGVLVFDVRDWNNSFKSKSINPVTEKSITLDNGQLHFKSETGFNKDLKQLLIKETHVLKTKDENEIDEYEFIMQCWTIDELKSNLKNAQFDKLDFYGDYNFDIECGTTEKIIVVAK